MKTPLTMAIEAVCCLANLEPERTARILAAAEGEKKPAVEKLLGKLHLIRRSKRMIRWKQSEIDKMQMGKFEVQGEIMPAIKSGIGSFFWISKKFRWSTRSDHIKQP